MKIFILFLILPLLLFSQVDLEEEGKSIFEEVKVESISKHAQSPENAPAFIYIIDKNTIKEGNFRTLDEVLRFLVPGFFIINDRTYSFVGTRGLFLFDDYNTKLLLLLNGHILNEPWNNFAGVGREMLIPLEIVERIEVVYGPSSLLYGGYSFYGIINVVTEIPEKNEKRVSLNYGSFNTKEFIFSNFIKRNSFSLIYSFGFYSSNGEDINLPIYELPDGSLWGGKQEGTDEEVAPYFYFYSRYKNFTFQGRAGYRNKNNPNAWYETKYGSKENYIIDRKNFLEISYKDSISLNSEISFRFFTDYYSFFEHDEYEDEEYYPGEEGYFYNLPAENLSFGFEGRYSHFFRSHYITFGFEGRIYDVKQGYYLEHLNGKKDPETEVKISSKQKFKLFYLQDEIKFGERARFVFGGNLLSLTPGKNIALPRFGLIYNLSENFNLKLISAQGFRNPSPLESDFYDVDYIQNKDLKSERILSNELNFSYKISKNNLFEISFYNNKAKDVIESVEVEENGEVFYQYQNFGKYKSKGIMAIYEANFNPFIFKLNFSVQKGEKEEEGNYREIKGIPKRTLKAFLNFKKERFSISLISFWQSEIKLLEGHLLQNKEKIPSQHLVNLNMNYSFVYFFPINIKIKFENLLNKKFYEPTPLFINIPYLPAKGREVILGFDLSF